MVRVPPGRGAVALRVWSWLRWLPALLTLVPWLAGTAPSTDQRIADLAAPAAFRLVDWEALNVAQSLDRIWAGLVTPNAPRPEDAATVQSYFQATGADHARLRPAAEAAIERAVAAAYARTGVVRQEEPLGGRPFPPVVLALTAPPNVLVISPRSEIRVAQSIILTPALDGASQERLEASADSTGVSSLVAPIGGLATYPAMVLDEAAPDRVLSSAAHEWLHQYLFFYPLGAGYWRLQETREINETTADLVGQEIGAQVQADLGLGAPAPVAPPAPSGRRPFDFRSFMRETRQEGERLLAQGRIDAAEAYFTGRRDELRGHGYAIRKLNQAYFAFYGSYAESFAASPTNPIADLLRQLRRRSLTLGAFLLRVRTITTVDGLRQAAQTDG